LEKKPGTEAYASVEAGVCSWYTTGSDCIVVVREASLVVGGDRPVEIVAGLTSCESVREEPDDK
jgi:hypothetical protein